MESHDIAAIAARCLKDPHFAQEVLEGKQNYPAVREAMVNDIVEGIRETMLKAPTAQHEHEFMKMFSPAHNPSLLQAYIKYGPKPGGVNLGKLAGTAACW